MRRADGGADRGPANSRPQACFQFFIGSSFFRARLERGVERRFLGSVCRTDRYSGPQDHSRSGSCRRDQVRGLACDEWHERRRHYRDDGSL